MQDFCTRLHITPNIREFHEDEDNSDPHLYVSDQSSDISDNEKKSKLKQFTDAFRMGQVAALKMENKRKRGMYSKRSKKTLKCHKQVQVDLASKGFLPVDEYIRLKGKQENHNELTEWETAINIVQDESEESSDANTLARDTCTHISVDGTSEAESDGILPAQLHLTCHHAHMESEESSDDDDGNAVGDYAWPYMSEDEQIEDDEGIHTASKHLEGL